MAGVGARKKQAVFLFCEYICTKGLIQPDAEKSLSPSASMRRLPASLRLLQSGARYRPAPGRLVPGCRWAGAQPAGLAGCLTQGMAASAASTSWEIKMLYDSECPLCLMEVLRKTCYVLRFLNLLYNVIQCKFLHCNCGATPRPRRQIAESGP